MSNFSSAEENQILARCTKCRKNNDHVILTKDGETPLEVQCTICSRQHKYRPPTAAKKSVGRKIVDHRENERKEWAAQRPHMNSAAATNYSMTEAFKVKSLISHSLFGLGLVQRVIGPQKIEVLFEDGIKKLRCK